MLDHVLDVANGPKVNVVNLSEYCRMQLVCRVLRSSACIVFRFDATCQFLKALDGNEQRREPHLFSHQVGQVDPAAEGRKRYHPLSASNMKI
jgi:hypothetical protein